MQLTHSVEAMCTCVFGLVGCFYSDVSFSVEFWWHSGSLTYRWQMEYLPPPAVPITAADLQSTSVSSPCPLPLPAERALPSIPGAWRSLCRGKCNEKVRKTNGNLGWHATCPALKLFSPWFLRLLSGLASKAYAVGEILWFHGCRRGWWCPGRALARFAMSSESNGVHGEHGSRPALRRELANHAVNAAAAARPAPSPVVSIRGNRKTVNKTSTWTKWGSSLFGGKKDVSSDVPSFNPEPLTNQKRDWIHLQKYAAVSCLFNPSILLMQMTGSLWHVSSQKTTARKWMSY